MATANIMKFLQNQYYLKWPLNIMKFLPNQYYLKCKYSGINSIKLQVYLPRNQYRVSNPIQVSIDIEEIWYRTGTVLMHETCETCICYCPIEKVII